MSRLLALRQKRAFERMYRRHVADVYRYALAVLRDPEDAEQVTQTTFVNAYRDPGRPRRANVNWLLGITYELCRRRDGDLRFEQGLWGLEDPTADDARRALARLPFDERSVLALREVEGRSYTDIAKTLALPPSEVEELMFRARRSLQEHLQAGLTCREAQLAVSRDLDGHASRRERRLLREHLRSCVHCHVFAQDQHAQRDVLRQLAAVQLPRSLEIFGITRKVSAPSASRL
jgi:RNA polymerase sigma-70 factor (ECF subfamily)